MPRNSSLSSTIKRVRAMGGELGADRADGNTALEPQRSPRSIFRVLPSLSRQMPAELFGPHRVSFAHRLHALPLLRREIAQFGAVGHHVVELPLLVRIQRIPDQLPRSLAHRTGAGPL